MSTPYESLQLALHLHQSGDYAQAEALYRQVLDSDPRNADAHHLLGLLAITQDEPARAIEHVRTAIECNPAPAQFHFHLATALARTGRKLEAVESFRQAVQIDPRSATMQVALGTALREAGQPNQAEASYREAVRLDPLLADAHNNLGNALQDLGRLEEAVAAIQAAARLRPDLAEIHFNLGSCYKELGQTSEGIAAYRQAATLKPELAMAHQNLGLLLQIEKQFEQAVECHRRAIELQPTLTEAHVALGVALHYLKKLDEAKACYYRALEIDSDDVTAQYNLASALHAEGEFDDARRYYQAVLEAVPDHGDSLSGLGMVHMLRGELSEARSCLQRALQHWPDAAEARFFHATMLLAAGELTEGWKEWEYRFECRLAESRTFDEPRWDGSPLEGRTLLVHAEYGYGDMFQFIRYDPLVRQRAKGGRVLVEVHPNIIPLLIASGYRDLVPQGQPTPHFDVQVPMMSLPGIFETTLETIPADVPYLHADSGLVEKWRERLADVDGLKVGIHWQGNPKYAADRLRSFRLSSFAPLAEVPGVTFVILQKGPGRTQLDEFAGRWSIVDVAGELTDFHETAAVVRNLDLVISCDSAPAHLVGGLGSPIWIALSFAPDWRWMHERQDSPWYPSARLFRQPKLLDWTSVFQRMAVELAKLTPRAKS